MTRELRGEPADAAAGLSLPKYAGFIAGIVDAGAEGMRVRLLVGPVVCGGELVPYELLVDPDEGSMVPEGELAACFEVLHEHAGAAGLDDAARRRWLVARVADELVARLLRACVLEPVVVDARRREVDGAPHGEA